MFLTMLWLNTVPNAKIAPSAADACKKMSARNTLVRENAPYTIIDCKSWSLLDIEAAIIAISPHAPRNAGAWCVNSFGIASSSGTHIAQVGKPSPTWHVCFAEKNCQRIASCLPHIISKAFSVHDTHIRFVCCIGGIGTVIHPGDGTEVRKRNAKR